MNALVQELEPKGAVTVTVTCVPSRSCRDGWRDGDRAAGDGELCQHRLGRRRGRGAGLPDGGRLPRPFIGCGRQVLLEKDRVGGLDRPQCDNHQQRQADGKFHRRRSSAA